MNPSPRVIRVQGRGRLAVRPDRIHLCFTVRSTHADFDRSVRLCNDGVRALREAAAATGAQAAQLQTGCFRVSEETSYEGGRRQGVGFSAEQSVTLILPWEREHVGKVLAALLGSGARPQVALHFDVADQEPLKQAVLAEAVRNARNRAEVLAQAAGIGLGRLVTLEYGTAELFIRNPEAGAALGSPGTVACEAPEVEPEDLVVEDTVTLVWELGGP